VLSWSMVLHGVHLWGCPVGVMVRWTDLTGGGLLCGVLFVGSPHGRHDSMDCRDCSCVILGGGVLSSVVFFRGFALWAS